MIACATFEGKLPFKIQNLVKLQSVNLILFSKVNILPFQVKLIKHVISNSCHHCTMMIFQVFSSTKQKIKWYFRFIPTEKYNPYNSVPLALTFYQSDINGNFIKDLSGVYPEQFYSNNLYTVFSDYISSQPYYCTVNNIDIRSSFNMVIDQQDFVFLEISLDANFKESYKFRLKD